MIKSGRSGSEDDSLPLVSIGLPVFNGERYLRQAIESVLTQDYPVLELIIHDNASTDGTERICREIAESDPRVRYFRNSTNLGAAANYNLCFEKAHGTYYKWAAHDDLLGSGFISRAVAALEAAPEAVLCMVGVTEIDGAGHTLRTYVNQFPGIDSPNPARRFGAVIHARHQCEDFFGLFRREALVGSALHGAYSGSDRVLLAEMALRGPWVCVPDPLFLHREHAGRYTRAILLKDAKEAALWQDPSQKAKPVGELFNLLVYRHYPALIRRNLRNAADRLACYLELGRWWFTDEHVLDMVRERLEVHPHVYARVRSLKLRLFGTAEARPGSLPELK